MTRLFYIAIVILVAPGGLAAVERLTFDASDFEGWRHHEGLVNVRPDGIEVRRFGTTYNAVVDADSFTSRTIGHYGVRKVRSPSNQPDADRAADLDASTWWQPDPDDAPQKWWLELDLGRAVVASKIRLVFPDTADVDPFRFFSVYTSPGAQIFGGDEERVVLTKLRPITDNTSRVVEFDLITVDRSRVAAPHLVSSDTLDFEIVRFIRFVSQDLSPGGALAEIEVSAVGFNLATRVAIEDRIANGDRVWGGRTWTSDSRDCSGCGKGSGAEALIDGDLSRRRWTIETLAGGGWRSHGIWSVVDLGSVFRVNRIVWLPVIIGVSPLLYAGSRDRNCPWEDIQFLTSDGSPSTTADPEVEGPYVYDLLSSVVNDSNPRRFLYDFQFPARDTRLVLWRHTGIGGTCRALQLFIFHSEGYPAQVELESQDMELARALSIRHVEWDADVPPGTRVEVATQTGNDFETITRYYLSNGKEVTKTAYDAAKSRNRGDIVEEILRDASWSGWSRPHRFSGQEFLSPTPRRWLRVRTRLFSDDPEVMPKLRSISLVMDTPVISGGITGSIWPREASLDSLTEFRYHLQPGGADGDDPGFDQVLIALPPGSDGVALVGVDVGGRAIAPKGELRHDTLRVWLPPPAVKGDSVVVVFTARVVESPSVFNALVAHSRNPVNTQSVNPVRFGAAHVYVPEAVAAATLLREVRHTEVLTPNGDGVGDEMTVDVTVLKATRVPRVGVYSLAGSLVAQLRCLNPGSHHAAYTWDGRMASGALVPPGIYLLRVHLHTDTRDDTVLRVVHVVY